MKLLRHVGRTSLNSIATAATLAILLSAVMADTSSAESNIIWLPVAAVDHPLTVCRGGMTEAEATTFALNYAERSGFGPPPGATEPEILLLERLTAAAADRIHGEWLGLTTDTPHLEPWECVWVVELSGRKQDVGGPPSPWTPTPGPPPPPVYWENMRLAILDATRWVRVVSLSRPIDPTPAPTVPRGGTPTPTR